MTFKSIEEFKNHILTKSEPAIRIAQDKITMIINHFLTQFYNEYDPTVYVRTEQLLRSLTKKRVVSTPNGWKAEVYFDIDALDYHIHTMKVKDKIYTYEDKNGWSNEQILDNTMTGSLPHGGAAGGTAIWNESVKALNFDAVDILKGELIKAGIPIK